MALTRLDNIVHRYGSILLAGVCGLVALACCLPPAHAQQLSGQTASTRRLSGQIVSARTGLPVPRALVRFNDRALLADHDGKFEFDQLAEISGDLQVVKPGFAMGTDPSTTPSLHVQIDELNGPIEIRLYPEAILTGTLTTPDGEPLPPILVQVRRSVFDESGHHWYPAGSTQTDTHGKFRLPVPAGDYKIQTQYVPSTAKGGEAVLPVSVPLGDAQGSARAIHVHSGEEKNFDLHPTLRRTFPVMLRVEGDVDQGHPFITARRTDGTTLPINALPSEVAGELRTSLPIGSYTLTGRIANPDYVSIAEANVDVSDHDISGVVLKFVPIPAIPIELQVDSSSTSDNPPPNISQFGLSLQNADPSGEIGYPGVQINSRREAPSTLNAAPGTYRLQARNANQWYIKSASYGASDLFRQNLILTAGSGGVPIRLIVSNQTGTLQGLTTLNGRPTSTWLYLINGNPSATPVLTLHSNPDGTFTDPYIPPGTYQVIAFEDRYSADLADPATVAMFSDAVQSVTVAAGTKSTLTLDAVSQSELAP